MSKISLIGAGQIGAKVAKLSKAFDITTTGMRRDVSKIDPVFDHAYPMTELMSEISSFDIVVLCCPLTDETKDLFDKAVFSKMKKGAYLINVARGGCVVEKDLIAAIESQQIGAAGIDVTDPEPLPASSPLWSMENVILTPHTGGETRLYEDNVLDILVENIKRLENGEETLMNQIV